MPPSLAKRRRLPEARPQQILDAALEIFGERGLADARLEDIAKRAGVAKGTIYLYFPNKEALFKEVIRQTVIAHLEQSERDISAGSHASATTRIRDYAHQWWTFLRSPAYQTVNRLIIGELHRFPELVTFYWDEVVVRRRQLMDRLIRRGMMTGEFRNIDPTVAARILASMFVSHALWGSSGFCAHALASLSDDQVFEQLMDFFFHALAPSTSASS